MRPIRLLPALVGLALALTPLAAFAPAGAAQTGTLAVTMVDEHGDPMPGQITVVDGDELWDESVMQVAVLEREVPAGAYGVYGLTPWGGLLCVGLESPCDYLSLVTGTIGPDGSVLVEEGQRTDVVVGADEPASLPDKAVVGKPVTVDWSEGMDALLAFFQAQGGGIYVPVVQWLRDGEPIEGAVGQTYVPVGADAGKELSALLSYQAVMAAQWEVLTGEPVAPRTVDGVTVSRMKTKSFADLASPTIPAGRQGRVRVDVTAPDVTVTGKVRVTVGDWSRTETLRNGSARIVLPELPPGKHSVSARYLGTREYAPSKAKQEVLTVEPRRDRPTPP